jgi:hypothetical protein
LGAYDMIIGRDLLEFLGIDVKFSDMREGPGEECAYCVQKAHPF